MDANLAKALSHPLRVEILERLSEERASPKEMAESIGIGISALSYHFRALSRAGYIQLVHEEQRRGAVAHFYEITPVVRSGMIRPVEVPAPVRPHATAALLQEIIDAKLAAFEQGSLEDEDSHLSCLRVALDEKGCEEIAESLVEARERVLAAHRKSAERLGGDTAGRKVTIALAGFRSASAQQGGQEAG